ncbi:MAG: SgcJ/EcaC family oxidoreductase [Hyphomicrobiales bacterium]|nr:SgcJ/EcaC family oxidoreductase [Hyphomicrobiales bacterium]
MRRAPPKLTLALAAGTLIWAPQASAACSPPTEADVAEMFGRWSAALETVHPDRVVRLYAPDALMLPLAAHGARKGAAEIRDYYVYFLQREPKVSVETRSIRADCSVVTDAGVYELKSKTRAGKPETFKVRYSFTWQKQDQNWLIVHEHASIGPDKGSPDRSAIGPIDPLAVPAPIAAAAAIKPKVAGFVKRAAKPVQARAQQKAAAPKTEASARRDVQFDAR